MAKNGTHYKKDKGDAKQMNVGYTDEREDIHSSVGFSDMADVLKTLVQ
jgi:hypothetical protein